VACASAAGAVSTMFPLAEDDALRGEQRAGRRPPFHRVEGDADARVQSPQVIRLDDVLRRDGAAVEVMPPSARGQPVAGQRLAAPRLGEHREMPSGGRRPDAGRRLVRPEAANFAVPVVAAGAPGAASHGIARDRQVGRKPVERLHRAVRASARQLEARDSKRSRTRGRAKLGVAGDLAAREARRIVSAVHEQRRPQCAGGNRRPRRHQSVAEAARIAEQPVATQEERVDRIDKEVRDLHAPYPQPPAADRAAGSDGSPSLPVASAGPSRVSRARNSATPRNRSSQPPRSSWVWARWPVAGRSRPQR